MAWRSRSGLLAQVVCWVTTLAALCLGGCKTTSLGPVKMVGKLEKPLADLVAKAPTNRLISIFVRMEQQFTEADKRALFASLAGTNQVQQMEMQRTNLINQLQQLAAATQAPLLGYLHGLESNGVVRHVRSMWLSNGIGVEAPPPVITNLATFNGVESIHLDPPRHVIQSSVEIPWGLQKIGIPLPVAPTIKQTVVVAVLDTGVDYTHTDLAKHFWVNLAEDHNHNGMLDPSDNNSSDDDTNGYDDKDDVIGWNFHKPESNDVMDLNGHGTHIAGIIVGDGTDGVRTGIIPEAKIMALREGADPSKPKVTQQECWRGMEYAVLNKAHIINFSSGWTKGDYPLYPTWRENVQNATDAGVLFVTVSGDTGGTVHTPGSVATALTVGASGSLDEVPSWSCAGPVTWWGIKPWSDYPAPPGLLKPDLVAPGEFIKSAQLGGKYVEMSGTSMAAPHVAGVAALLRAQDPNLNPYEVRYLLEESAQAIVTTPPPKAAWGRVDAKNALAASLIQLPPYDMSVDLLGAYTVSTPALPTLKLNKPTLFFANVSNLGGQVVGNAEVRFYFKDAEERDIGDLGSSLAPEPSKAQFEYIGSYFIPVLGPNGSKHSTVRAVVQWKVPTVKKEHWWLGVRVLRGPTNKPESYEANNVGVKRLD